jgi:ribonuclease D
MNDTYTLIDDKDTYERFLQENENIEWLVFDTEFVGEKRYHTLICLLQVGTINGCYIIDPFAIKDLRRFYDLLENPAILKITHAGENDYRLLYRSDGVLPKNVFDAQVAAGFVGYSYPTSFGKLVESECGVSLGKGYTVSNWESRPMNDKQLHYALNDILYLKELHDKLSKKLKDANRTEWAAEEFAKMESASHYEIDIYREAFSSAIIKKLNTKEQIFLIRLFEWRRQIAERRNHSKEMVLPAKYIAAVIKNIRSGKEALKDHRRLPNHIIDQYWDKFNELYQTKVTDEEKALLKNIPPDYPESNGQDTNMELMTLLLRMKAEREGIAIGLLTFGVDIKRMKADNKYNDEELSIGWRKAFIGEAMLHWIKNREFLDVDFSREEVILKLKEKGH